LNNQGFSSGKLDEVGCKKGKRAELPALLPFPVQSAILHFDSLSLPALHQSRDNLLCGPVRVLFGYLPLAAPNHVAESAANDAEKGICRLRFRQPARLFAHVNVLVEE
jgi:hypothetical protein